MDKIIKDAFVAIDNMSKNEVYGCITKVLLSEEVSKLMTSDVSFLSDAEIEKIKDLIVAARITPTIKITDDEVVRIIHHLSSRAFARR